MLDEAVQQFTNLKLLISETNLSNTSLRVDALLFISKAESAYQELTKLPDKALVTNQILIEIARFLETMVLSGKPYIDRLDEHRKLLDYSYGTE